MASSEHRRSASTHIVKRFPGVVALDDVSVEIAAGSLPCALRRERRRQEHARARSSPASTRRTPAGCSIFGKPVVSSAARARRSRPGSAMVHQELAFCENLSVAENLCLGVAAAVAGRSSIARRDAAPRRGDAGRHRRRHRRATAASASSSIGQQQMLQIAAAVGRGARIIVFDEPTSSLSQHEAEALYALIGRLRARGVTLHLREPPHGRRSSGCATRSRVLRDGRHVGHPADGGARPRRSWCR